MITKPLLAETCEDISLLRFPVYASFKYDGIRCLIINNIPVSRNFKKIPNAHISNLLSGLPSGLDGELLSGKTFQECTSAVMSEDGIPDFTYFVFDYVKDDLNKPYLDRMKDLDNLDLSAFPFISKVMPTEIKNESELRSYEDGVLANGYEGVMVRSANGRYKCGRSSVKEGILLKIKRFVDSEAEIVGFEELMHNNNVATKDAFGRTERSSHKANLVGSDTLGAVLVKDVKSGIEFKIGTGFDADTRKSIWNNRDELIGSIIKYKSFPVGVKEAPRFPVFLGFRHQNDM